ncbi:MAG: quinone-interacting membrane-bound oxidoreductase complex subunit QmoC [Thermodesulfobacteriota bacterium]
MSAKMLEPDVKFIKELNARGGDTLKKCYQCATCSVVCPIAPDNKPFPRKEMIAASWGLSDRLTSDMDVWLCHQCGDCSEKCPRGAKPGDVLGAIRNYAIESYAKPKWLAQAVNDPKKLPILIAIPLVLFLVMGKIIGPILMKVLGPILNLIFASETPFSQWNLLNFHPHLDIHGQIATSEFFSSWLVDITFVPTMIFAVVVFLLSLKAFVNDMHQNAVAEGKVQNAGPLSVMEMLKTLPKVLVTILSHRKFSECSANKSRATSHMMVLFGFIGLFIVTGIFFVVLYGSMLFTGYEHAWHAPYSQWLPVKWLANASGLALAIGALAMIKDRLSKDPKHAKTAYQDWFLIGLVMALAVTGLGTEMARLAGAATVTYIIYYLHLTAVWMLFAYTPFSKLAHLVYRTTAMVYAEYAGREVKAEA